MGIKNLNNYNNDAKMSVQPNINKALQILQMDYHIHSAEIKTGLCNGIEYHYIRIAYWQQLPFNVFNAIKHLVSEDCMEDDDTLPKYSYKPLTK